MAQLDELLEIPAEGRPGRLLGIGRAVLAAQVAADRAAVAAYVSQLLAEPVGTGRERLELGELLGELGDPRLRVPGDADYWVHIDGELDPVVLGRFLVTNHEYRRWIEAGGYKDDAAWSAEGRQWRDQCEDPWPVRAEASGSEPFIVPNQPVVGVTFFEADAYARAMGARLPRADERVTAIRGREKRPYPWGSPFGEGNANTREEVLGRPCAVGLFLRDRTPEGVYDLAGNVAEWTSDAIGGECVVHPGAWDQPSLAAWAKALAMVRPDSRWAGLGFRLAKD